MRSAVDVDGPSKRRPNVSAALIAGIVDLVRVGFTGVAVALAILTYKLLSQEQKTVKARPPVLKSIERYGRYTLVLIALSGGLTILDWYIRSATMHHALQGSAVQTCHDRMIELSAVPGTGD